MFFIIISAIHISAGFSAHHQELIKLNGCLGYCHAFLLSTAGVDGLELRSSLSTPTVDSRKAWQYPRLHIQFYKFLMMDGKTARNMYSADNNKEHCVSCISLVI